MHCAIFLPFLIVHYALLMGYASGITSYFQHIVVVSVMACVLMFPRYDRKHGYSCPSCKATTKGTYLMIFLKRQAVRR